MCQLAELLWSSADEFRQGRDRLQISHVSHHLVSANPTQPFISKTSSAGLYQSPRLPKLTVSLTARHLANLSVVMFPSKTTEILHM